MDPGAGWVDREGGALPENKGVGAIPDRTVKSSSFALG
jgi:hypothetical protein